MEKSLMLQMLKMRNHPQDVLKKKVTTTKISTLRIHDQFNQEMYVQLLNLSLNFDTSCRKAKPVFQTVIRIFITHDVIGQLNPQLFLPLYIAG